PASTFAAASSRLTRFGVAGLVALDLGCLAPLAFGADASSLGTATVTALPSPRMTVPVWTASPLLAASRMRFCLAAPSARAALALMRAAFLLGASFVVVFAMSNLLRVWKTAKPATSGLQVRGRISMSRPQAGQTQRVGGVGGGADRRPAAYARSSASRSVH